MRQPILSAGAAVLLLAAFAAAKAPTCRNTGLPPTLNGDPFAPVECSTAPKAAVPLPGEPPAPPSAPDLKALEGRWEGLLVRGFGRYASTLEVKTGWRGKAALTLRWKEQQLRTTGESRLALAPAKTEGGYRAALSASLLPDAELAGLAQFSQETTKDGGTRSRADFSFPNGAAHRVRWSFPEKDLLRFTAVWAVPEAPLQTLEGELRRVPR